MAWAAHFYSYAGFLNGRWYCAALILTVVSIVPLISLFVKVKRGRPLLDTWPLFWSKVLHHCPRIVASSMTIAFACMMIAFVRQILGSKGLVLDQFQTAALAIFASAGFSYAVTLLYTRNLDGLVFLE